MSIDIAAPGARRGDLVAALQSYMGPLEPVAVAGPVTYLAASHLNRLLELNAGLGEVPVTLPANATVGQAMAVSSPSDSWPHLVLGGGATLRHPYGHTRGLPKSIVSLMCVKNEGGSAAVWALTGGTQP